MVIGAIEVKTRRPLGVIWHRITKGAPGDRALANPYLALAQHLKKQDREQKEQRRGGSSRSLALALPRRRKCGMNRLSKRPGFFCPPNIGTVGVRRRRWRPAREAVRRGRGAANGRDF